MTLPQSQLTPVLGLPKDELLLIIDYATVLDSFTDFARRIDQACRAEDVVDTLMFLIGSYFSKGYDNALFTIHEIVHNADDEIEVMYGDEAVHIVEKIDAITRYWMPGYPPYGIDVHGIDLYAQNGTSVTLQVKRSTLDKFTVSNRTADSSGDVDRFYERATEEYPWKRS